MVLYAGETITVRCDAKDPRTSEVVVGATGTAEFYAPGKNPAKTPADRVPDSTSAMTYDPVTTSYVANVDTRGWLPGKWTYRVQLRGEFLSWEYGTFTLRA